MPLHGNLRAIVAMIAACAMFGCMDAVLKALAGTYPPLQVTALRGLTAMPLVCLYVLWRGQMGAVFARGLRWRLHLLRGVITVAMMALFTFGLKTLGLAEAYTLTFIAPMIITMLSVPMLKETVPPRHWAAIAVGLCGVVVALRPDQSAFLSIGALAVLAAALCYALSNVVGRIISRTEPSATLVFWTTGAMALGGGVLSVPQWVDILPVHWPLAGRPGRQRLSRAAGHHRGLPPRPGLGRGALRIHRAGLGRAAGLGVLARGARRLHAGRRRHHHRQRHLPDPARGTARDGRGAALRNRR